MFLPGLIVSSDRGTWDFQMQSKNKNYGLLHLLKNFWATGTNIQGIKLLNRRWYLSFVTCCDMVLHC